MNYDLSVFNFFHGLAGQSKWLDWLVIFLGEYFPYLVAAGFLVWLYFEEDWRTRIQKLAFAVLVIVLARGILAEVIRFIYFRARPFAALDFMPLFNHEAVASFPSGHATLFFAGAFSVFYFSKRWGIWGLVAASFISVARVVAGVHWPLDIFAGALVALLSFLVVKWALAKYLK